MATSSITANFEIKAPAAVRAFVDAFLSSEEPWPQPQPTTNVETMKEIYENKLSAESMSNLKLALGKTLESFYTDLTDTVLNGRMTYSSYQEVILRFVDLDLCIKVEERKNPTENDADISQMSVFPCSREYTEAQCGTTQNGHGNSIPDFRNAHPIGKRIRRIFLVTNLENEPMTFDNGREVWCEDLRGIAFAMGDKTLVLDKGISFSETWDVTLQNGENPKFKDVDEARIEVLS